MTTKLKYLLIPVTIITLAVGCLFSACKTTPAPGGVYEGRQFLLETDIAIKDAWAVINGFMNWEYQNHATLIKQAPQVFLAEETIRTNAPLWTAVLNVAHSNYVYALEHSVSSTDASNALKSATSMLSSQAALSKALQK